MQVYHQRTFHCKSKQTSEPLFTPVTRRFGCFISMKYFRFILASSTAVLVSIRFALFTVRFYYSASRGHKTSRPVWCFKKGFQKISFLKRDGIIRNLAKSKRGFSYDLLLMHQGRAANSNQTTRAHFKIWTHFFLVLGPSQKLKFWFLSKLTSCLIIGIKLLQKLKFYGILVISFVSACL